MATKINPLVINKKTNPKLQPEKINPLVIRTGVRKGIKTNIKINENENGVPIKKPRGRKKGILSLDQKWRVYKTEVEPKLTDRLLQAEPSEMLENIKQAFHETVAPGMAKLLSDTKKDNADLNSDIITPSHINTSIKQKTEAHKVNQKEEDNSMMGRAMRGMEETKKEKEVTEAHNDKNKNTAFQALKEFTNHKQTLRGIKESQNNGVLKGALEALRENKDEEKQRKEEERLTLSHKEQRKIRQKQNKSEAEKLRIIQDKQRRKAEEEVFKTPKRKLDFTPEEHKERKEGAQRIQALSIAKNTQKNFQEQLLKVKVAKELIHDVGGEVHVAFGPKKNKKSGIRGEAIVTTGKTLPAEAKFTDPDKIVMARGRPSTKTKPTGQTPFKLSTPQSRFGKFF